MTPLFKQKMAALLLIVAIFVATIVLVVVIVHRSATAPTPDAGSDETSPALVQDISCDIKTVVFPKGELTAEDARRVDIVFSEGGLPPENFAAIGTGERCIFYNTTRLSSLRTRERFLLPSGTGPKVSYGLLSSGKQDVAVFVCDRFSDMASLERLLGIVLCYKDYYPVILAGVNETMLPYIQTALDTCNLKTTVLGKNTLLTAHTSAADGTTDNTLAYLNFSPTPFSLDLAKPKIALTYDDGPNDTYTPKILDTLEEKKAKATFFVMGAHASQYPDLLKRQVSLGCEIGNHTYLHEVFSENSNSIVCKTVEDANDAIRAAVGLPAFTVRPPTGRTENKRGEKVRIGYPIILWTVDTYDYKNGKTGHDVYTDAIAAKSGNIVLMHDIHMPSSDATADIIDYFTQKGFQLVTVSELIEFSDAPAENDKVYSNIR